MFGWSDNKYNHQYWQNLERKLEAMEECKTRRRGKGKLTVVHEVVEEEGGKIEEWNEEDEME